MKNKGFIPVVIGLLFLASNFIAYSKPAFDTGLMFILIGIVMEIVKDVRG